MKYTIELTDKQKAQMDCMMEIVHRYVGFNPKLEPVKTINVEDTNEYQIGYKTGYDIAQTNAQATKKEWGKVEYNKALNDVNHAMTVLGIMTETEREEWFEDYASVDEVVREFTIQRIVESTKAYKEKKAEEIKVGDVIYSQMTDSKAIIISFDAWDNWNCIDTCGTGFVIDKSKREFWKKIGHFDEVEQLLSKLQAN